MYEAVSLTDEIDRIMEGKPADADHYIDSLYTLIQSDDAERPTVTFVQFADTHMDYKYLEGTTADCG